MKSMLVIGLGRFGRHLSMKLAELGNEVMVVDKDEANVQRLAPYVTSAHVADCQDEEVIRELGISNFDVCFVCVSGNFQSSLEITSTLRDMGAKFIVSKADREKQAKFLDKIGADVVIHAEMDMAQRVAVRFSTKNAFDYIELTPEYAITEILVPESWVGKTIGKINVRSKYHVNIIGYKNGDDKVIPVLTADHVFGKEEHLLLAGNIKDTMRMTGRS